MMIHKYPLTISGTLPAGEIPLSVGFDLNDAPSVWTWCETCGPLETWHINLYCTGDDVPRPAKFLGTLQINGLIYHAFARQVRS